MTKMSTPAGMASGASDLSKRRAARRSGTADQAASASGLAADEEVGGSRLGSRVVAPYGGAAGRGGPGAARGLRAVGGAVGRVGMVPARAVRAMRRAGRRGRTDAARGVRADVRAAGGGPAGCRCAARGARGTG